VSRENAGKYRELLRAGRWFHDLPELLQTELLAAASVRHFERDQRLFARGDAPSGLFAVLHGAVRVIGVTESGDSHLLTLAEPPMWFGEVGVLDEQPHCHEGVADADSRVVFVPQAAALALAEREPLFWRALGQLAASKLRLTFMALQHGALLPIPARMARRLVLMAEGYGEWRDRKSSVIDARQEQLAEMLAVSRQTVNQVLRGLADQGLIRLAYGRIEIVDLEGLRLAGAA
jgi:CRP-like cAMP-binding protein